MKAFVFCVLAVFGVISAVHAADAAPEMLLKKLSSLAGADRQDCGVVPLRGNRDAAIQCAEATASAGKSYTLALQIQGVDTYTWQGAVRDAAGRLWVVFYDSDSSSGAAASPSVAVILCRALTFAAKSDEPIGCTPSAGQ